MHRTAAEMDGWFRVTAGVVSSDPARARAAGVAVGLDPARSYGDVAEMLAQGEGAPRPRRCGRDHDVERHALPVCGRGARRRPRRRRRQAGHARFQGGVRSRRAHAQERPDLRDRARLFRLPDDPLRAAARARRCARGDPPGPGRVHPERPRDAPRGRPAEQPSQMGARSRTERPRPRDERHRLPRAASRDVRVGAAGGPRRRRRPRADARPQGHRLHVRADRVRRRRARHVHRHAGRGRRRERHPAPRLRREGHARMVASRARAISSSRCRANRRARSPAAIPSCRPRSSPWAHSPRPSRRTVRGVRQHLRRSGAGTDGALARRGRSRLALSAHRGGRAHDGVHRGVHRVAGEGRVGRRPVACRRPDSDPVVLVSARTPPPSRAGT